MLMEETTPRVSAPIPLRIVEEHHEAFPHVMLAAKALGAPLLLLHVDQHADLAPPRTRRLPPDPADVATLRAYATGELGIDSFIAPLVGLGAVGEVVWLDRARPEGDGAPVMHDPSAIPWRMLRRRGQVDAFVRVEPGSDRCFRLGLDAAGVAAGPGGSIHRFPVRYLSSDEPESVAAAFREIAGPYVLDIDLDWFSCSGDPMRLVPLEVEVTEAGFSALQSIYHPLNLLREPPRLVRREGACVAVFNRTDDADAGALRATEAEIARRMQRFRDDLLALPRLPSLIVVARSRHSGFTPADQWAFIEARLLAALGSVFELAPGDDTREIATPPASPSVPADDAPLPPLPKDSDEATVRRWTGAVAAAVVSATREAVAARSCDPAQAQLLAVGLHDMRLAQGSEDRVLSSAHLAVALALDHGASATVALQVAVVTTLIETGIDIIDNIADRELAPHWAGLPTAAASLVGHLFVSGLPMALLADLAVPDSRKSAILAEIGRLSAAIAFGQQEDYACAGREDVPLSRIEASYRRKTGARHALLLLIALHAAGCTDPQALAAAERFGSALGLSLQVRSDIAHLLGADPTRDLRNATHTWPIAWALRSASGAGRIHALRLLDPDDGSAHRIVGQLKDCGAIVAAMLFAQRQAALARAEVAAFTRSDVTALLAARIAAPPVHQP